MQHSSARSGSMLISVYVDPDSATGWYAHIYSYTDAFQKGTDSRQAITVSEVCKVTRNWLRSVVTADSTGRNLG